MEYKKEKMNLSMGEICKLDQAIGSIYSKSPGGKLGHALSRNAQAIRSHVKTAKDQLEKIKESNTRYFYYDDKIKKEIEKLEKVTEPLKVEIRDKHKKGSLNKKGYEDEETKYMEGTKEDVELVVIPLDALIEAEKEVGLIITSEGKNVHDEDGNAKTYKIFTTTPIFYDWAHMIIDDNT